jgi:hypothetical protein
MINHEIYKYDINITIKLIVRDTLLFYYFILFDLFSKNDFNHTL